MCKHFIKVRVKKAIFFVEGDYMNILFITHESGKEFNGSSRSLLNLIDILNSNDNELFVILNDYSGQLYKELRIRKINVWKIKYYNWFEYKPSSKIKWFLKKIKWTFYMLMINKISVLNINKKLITNEIGLIHSNSSAVNIGAIIHLKYKIPHIWHLREFGQEDFNFFPLTSNLKYIYILNYGSNIFISNSNAIKDKFNKLINNKPIITIYNGFDTEKYHYKNKVVNESFNILISGTISQNKGQYQAILSLNKLIQSGYNDIHLYIAGRGDLNSIKKHIIYENNVHILDFVQDLDQLRKKMHLELMCSKNEAFGRVTVESMLNSNPVIGSNAGGTSELISDNFNGFLYSHNNIEELSEKIKNIYLSDELRNRLSRNAFEFAKKTFSNANNKEAILDLFKVFYKI